jgi:hypothetical protein
VNDRRADKGNSEYDLRHTITTNVVWELPFGPGRRLLTQGFGSKVLGGWEMSAIHSARTGRAINISITRPARDLPDGNRPNQRPSLVPGVPLDPENQTLATG